MKPVYVMYILNEAHHMNGDVGEWTYNSFRNWTGGSRFLLVNKEAQKENKGEDQHADHDVDVNCMKEM